MGQRMCSFHDGYEYSCEEKGDIKCDCCDPSEKTYWCSKHILYANGVSICFYCSNKLKTSKNKY